MKKNKVFTIPNILSFFRILLIPLFIWLYIWQKDYLLATIILLVSGLSDIIDGYIARTFDQTSRVGKILDPVADKLTQFAVLICLMTRFKYMFIAIVAFFVKEAIMLLLGVLLYRKNKYVMGSLWHGKVAAVLMHAMLIVHIAWGISQEIPAAVRITSVVITIVFMEFSLILYAIEYAELFKKSKLETTPIDYKELEQQEQNGLK